MILHTFKSVNHYDGVESLPNTPGKTLFREYCNFSLLDNGNYLLQEIQVFTGINSHSGKRWFRKVVVFRFTFNVKTLRNNQKFLYIWGRGRGRDKPGRKSHVTDSLPQELPLSASDLDVIGVHIIDMCVSEIGPYPEHLTSTVDILTYYNRPLLAGKSDAEMAILANFYTRTIGGKKPSFRTTTPKEFVMGLSKSRYRKDLVKSVVKSNSLFVSCVLIKSTPETIPTDWIVEAINESTKTSTTNYRLVQQNIEELVEIVPKKHQRKFFIQAASTLVRDTLNLCVIVGNTDFTGSVQAIHDRVLRTNNEREEVRRKSKEAEYGKKYVFPKDYEDVAFALEDSWFSVGRSKSQLVSWSTEMSNCISSYAQAAKTGNCMLLGYMNGNDLVANIEIKFGEAWTFPGKLNQNLGKYNRTLSSAEFWEISDLLVDYGIITEDSIPGCWGYVDR